MPTAILRLEKQGMLSRALSLATVTLLIGCLMAGVAAAENLDAGKSPSQIFSNTCNACHKSPRGLLKSVSASSLPGFLRQHYTTGTDMAAVLSSYLISNGAADPRYQGKDAKQKDAKQDGRPDQPDRIGRRQPPAAPAQEAARPDAEGTPQGEGGRRGRDAKRFARPHAVPDAAKPDGPAQAATDSKSGVRQKQGRRGKRPAAEEPAKTEPAAPSDAANEDASRDAAKAETATTDPAKTDAIKPDGVKDEVDKPTRDAAKPVGETEKPAREDRSDAAKVDAAKENAGSEPNPLRPDPVPAVTPAPPASETTAPEPGSSAASTATAPAPPAGPPVPPISR
jgi:hypothetical protein